MLWPLKIPPGVARGGTKQESAGRWYDTQLVRWVDGHLQPMKGWAVRNATQAALTGKARAIRSWRANAGSRWTAIGTSSKLYAQNQAGIVSDITPVGLTAGYDDPTIVNGYGRGPYGEGPYGRTRTVGTPQPPTVWDLDTWGEYLVACSDADGRLWEWTLVPAVKPAVIANAPTQCRGLVVTDERILMALAPSGNGRKVQWSDREDNTEWTVTALTLAGSFELKTAGVIVAARTHQAGVLILTNVDAWVAEYVGYPLVYGFRSVGEGCGLFARGAITKTADGRLVWWAKKGFWSFNGSYVEPIACPVIDYLNTNLSATQQGKVSAVHYADFGEVHWLYPSTNATEPDSYVVWSYREGWWAIGTLARTCGADAGPLTNPLMVGTDGLIYEHEVGFAYGGGHPHAESGPLELDTGERTMLCRGLVPDDATQGDVTASFYARMWPNGADTTLGPYTLSSPTDFMFSARSIRVRVTGSASSAWRVGIPKLDLVATGKR